MIGLKYQRKLKQNKIKPAINLYYLEVIDDMIRIIKNSESGKRIWDKCEITGRCDYGQTKRSTYPHWCKFYYVQTPKKEKINYILNPNRKPFEDGYFNGATDDLIKIMQRYKKGYCSRSKRVQIIFETCLAGFMQDVKDWEHENGEAYYK